MQQIDFSALGNPGQQIPRRRKISPTVIIIGILAMLLFVPVSLIALLIVGIIFGFMPVWLRLLVVLVFVAIIARWIINAIKKTNEMTKKFAAANGWQTNVPVPVNPVLAKIGFRFPNAKIGGTLEGNKFWMHVLEVPSTSSNQNIQSLEVITIEVPKPLPTLLIMPIGGILAGLFDRFPKETLGLERLKLEGDFNQLATAYGAPGMQIESLEYLTPDVMRVLVDQATSMVIYADKYITVVPNPTMAYPLQQEAALKDAQLLAKEVIEKQL